VQRGDPRGRAARLPGIWPLYFLTVGAVPETRFALSGDRRIAYQVVGEGPPDLVYAGTWANQVDSAWDWELYAAFLRRLAAFSRLILFDSPGAGASDALPVGIKPTMEAWSDDLRAVLDEVGSRRAALLGALDGGLMAIMFAATHPARTSALVLAETSAYLGTAPGYLGGIGAPPGVRAQIYREAWGSVGSKTVWRDWVYPSLSAEQLRAHGRFQRLVASPATAAAMYQMLEAIDLRPVLSAIRVPTLVLHRRDDRFLPIQNGRYLAEHIDGARFVQLTGADCSLVFGDNAEALDEIEEFLTGVRPAPEPDRVLVTLLFTDIAGSTELAARLGDHRWRDLLGQHHRLVRDQLARFRGREIDTAGDGFFATFDGPARAIRCALAIRDGVHALGLSIRAGLHTGEVELMEDKVGGIAVHTGARVCAHAAPDEILVSRTVTDLVAGSGIEFEDRGEHQLKGVPGNWRLFAVKG
jgi:class 3 adenylate cyclase